jgi:hypothetical protein
MKYARGEKKCMQGFGGKARREITLEKPRH